MMHTRWSLPSRPSTTSVQTVSPRESSRCVCLYVRARARAFIHLSIRMHAYLHLSIRVHPYAHIHVYTRARAYARTHYYTHTITDAYTHTRTRTPIDAPTLSQTHFSEALWVDEKQVPVHASTHSSFLFVFFPKP